LPSCVDRGWKLRELTRVRHSLEEVYIRLTRPESEEGTLLMQAYATLARRELGAFFSSWIGYVVIAGAVFLMG
jgi:hypothetical protein